MEKKILLDLSHIPDLILKLNIKFYGKMAPVQCNKNGKDKEFE